MGVQPVTSPRAAVLRAYHLVEEVQAERMLVLWGALDPVLPIWVGESVTKDLGSSCSMVTVPKAGHFVVEEAPEICLEAIQELLA